MEIRASGLLIRPANSADIDHIVMLWNDPGVMKYVGYPEGLKITHDAVQKKLADPAQTLLDRILMVECDGECIGQAVMHSPDSRGKSTTEIKLLPKWQAKGFGTKIKRLLLNYLFENTSCLYIEATPSLENGAGIRIQESVGAIRVGRGRFQAPSTCAAIPIDYWIYRVYREPGSHVDSRNRRFHYSAIVPAAGKSSRMGRCKHLLPWPPHSVDSGYCVIESAVQSLMNAGIDPIIVVVGYWKDLIRRRLMDWPVNIIENPDYRAPMSRSVQLALPKISDHSALLMLPGDHPSVDSETIRHLIELHERDPGKIFVPVFGSRGGHPTLFPPEAVPEMQKNSLAEGLRSIIKNPVFSVVRQPVMDPGIHKNIDTAEDYGY
ncbi:MAG: GNAT family N-acetyltransferase [bacterium]